MSGNEDDKMLVTLNGALNHSGAVTIKTFFSLAG